MAKKGLLLLFLFATTQTSFADTTGNPYRDDGLFLGYWLVLTTGASFLSSRDICVDMNGIIAGAVGVGILANTTPKYFDISKSQQEKLSVIPTTMSGLLFGAFSYYCFFEMKKDHDDTSRFWKTFAGYNISILPGGIQYVLSY